MTLNVRIRIRQYVIIRNYIESKNLKRQYTNNI